MTFSTRDIRLLREAAPATFAALLSTCGRASREPVQIPRLTVVHAAAA